MKKVIFVLFIFIFLLLTQNALRAEPAKSLAAVDFLTGFGWGKVHAQHGGLRSIPFMVDFSFDLKPLLNKVNINPKPLIQFQIEPILADIYSPKNNFEMGTTFWCKFGILPETSKFQPYAKLGAGIDYMTLHTREQSTQFNFVEQGAIGMHYFFTKN
ncbi:MAG: acyloxyacyl hydrolase, partial [Candidatus Omnitrophica bacterium]|nr:acyloxyacyl hydrolase [Candidatus Omnitrophota bacterium]